MPSRTARCLCRSRWANRCAWTRARAPARPRRARRVTSRRTSGISMPQDWNMESTSALEKELKTMIIETLMLEDIAPDDIDRDAPLFNEGLGLDSIDSLDLAMAL